MRVGSPSASLHWNGVETEQVPRDAAGDLRQARAPATP